MGSCIWVWAPSPLVLAEICCKVSGDVGDRAPQINQSMADLGTCTSCISSMPGMSFYPACPRCATAGGVWLILRPRAEKWNQHVWKQLPELERFVKRELNAKWDVSMVVCWNSWSLVQARGWCSIRAQQNDSWASWLLCWCWTAFTWRPGCGMFARVLGASFGKSGLMCEDALSIWRFCNCSISFKRENINFNRLFASGIRGLFSLLSEGSVCVQGGRIL